MLLTPADHQRIAAAIEAAERKTAGEIIGVVARECSDYWEVPLAWAAGISLIVPAVGLLLGWRPDRLARLGGGWTAAHVAAVDAAVGQAMTAYLIVQAVLFIVVLLLVSIPVVRRALTPGPLKHERVRRRAEEQFAARALHLTKGRSGVLIFASLAERRAEVVAGQAIAAKVPQEAWHGVLQALIAGMKAKDCGAGFADAIVRAGDLLAVHAPRGPDDTNELPDTVIELEH